MAATLPPRVSIDTWQSLAVAAAAFGVAFALSAWRVGHGAPDFYVFWTAAQHWQTPYDPAIIAHLEAQLHLTGNWPFAYPPTFLLIAWPFAQLPMTAAYPLWAGLEVGLFVYAAARMLKPAWVAGLLALTPIVFFSAALGQTSLVTAAAMLGAWQCRDARPVVAGVLLGLAACIKPQALALAPLVFWGRWRLLGAMAATSAALVLASLLFGWQRWLEWPHALASFRALAPATDRINPSALTPELWWSALVAALGIWLALSRRDLFGLVCGAVCVTPYAHAYDLAALTPIAARWILDFRRRGWPHAVTGGALLSGVVATPLAALLFCLAVAGLDLPQRLPMLRRFAVPAPVTGAEG